MQGPTWQQAVQRIQEVPLSDGDKYLLTVKHDTYGLSFALQADPGASMAIVPAANGPSAAASTVPLYVRLTLLMLAAVPVTPYRHACCSPLQYSRSISIIKDKPLLYDARMECSNAS